MANAFQQFLARSKTLPVQQRCVHPLVLEALAAYAVDLKGLPADVLQRHGLQEAAKRAQPVPLGELTVRQCVEVAFKPWAKQLRKGERHSYAEALQAGEVPLPPHPMSEGSASDYYFTPDAVAGCYTGWKRGNQLLNEPAVKVSSQLAVHPGEGGSPGDGPPDAATGGGGGGGGVWPSAASSAVVASPKPAPGPGAAGALPPVAKEGGTVRGGSVFFASGGSQAVHGAAAKAAGKGGAAAAATVGAKGLGGGGAGGAAGGGGAAAAPQRPSMFYVVHAWDAKFGDLVALVLRHYQDQVWARMDAASAKQFTGVGFLAHKREQWAVQYQQPCFYWLDFLGLPLVEQADLDLAADSADAQEFHRALAMSECVLVASAPALNTGLYIKRMWCLFELLLAARLQKQICLLAPLHPEAAGDKLATLEGCAKALQEFVSGCLPSVDMVTAEVGHPDHRDMLVHLVKGWLADLEIQAETSTASLLLLPVLASRRGVGDIPVVPGAAGRVAGGGGGGAPQPRAPTMQVVQDVVCARLRSACAESLLWGHLLHKHKSQHTVAKCRLLALAAAKPPVGGSTISTAALLQPIEPPRPLNTTSAGADARAANPGGAAAAAAAANKGGGIGAVLDKALGALKNIGGKQPQQQTAAPPAKPSAGAANMRSSVTGGGATPAAGKEATSGAVVPLPPATASSSNGAATASAATGLLTVDVGHMAPELVTLLKEARRSPVVAQLPLHCTCSCALCATNLAALQAVNVPPWKKALGPPPTALGRVSGSSSGGNSSSSVASEPLAALFPTYLPTVPELLATKAENFMFGAAGRVPSRADGTSAAGGKPGWNAHAALLLGASQQRANGSVHGGGNGSVYGGGSVAGGAGGGARSRGPSTFGGSMAALQQAVLLVEAPSSRFSRAGGREWDEEDDLLPGGKGGGPPTGGNSNGPTPRLQAGTPEFGRRSAASNTDLLPALSNATSGGVLSARSDEPGASAAAAAAGRSSRALLHAASGHSLASSRTGFASDASDLLPAPVSTGSLASPAGRVSNGASLGGASISGAASSDLGGGAAGKMPRPPGGGVAAGGAAAGPRQARMVAGKGGAAAGRVARFEDMAVLPPLA